MAQIYETKNFTVESFETPHVDREDGGHLRVVPKEHFVDRTEMPPEVAVEFIRFTMIIGEAFRNAMTKQGIELMRINYQDMGNWAYKTGKQPFFHLHIYGRARNAKTQPYTEAVNLPDRSTGFYDNFKPLNNEDCELIRQEIERIFEEEKYKDKNWHL